MNEQIKQLAEQADVYAKPFRFSLGGQNYQQVRDERFAELVRQDEREACAKLCESMGVHPALNVWGGGPEWYQRQKECAEAIRARGEK